MAQIVTVPGGNGTVIAIPFSGADNVNAAIALLQNLYYTPAPSLHVALASGGPLLDGAVPGDENELVDDISGQVQVPLGYQYLVGDYVTGGPGAYPVNSFIAGGTLNGAVIDSSPSSLSYQAGSGAVTVIAGGNVTITTLAAGGGNGVLMLDGAGTETVTLSTGNWSAVSGTGTGSFTLGSGQDTIYAEGTDTIRGGSGTAVAVLDHGHDVYQGGSGTATIVDHGTADTILAGSGLETVFGQGSGLRITGGGSEVLFIENTGGNTLTANSSGIVAFGGAIGSTYQAGNNYFLFTSGGGRDTINAAAGSKGPVVFGTANAHVQINAAAPGSFVVAGSGNETVDASQSSAGAVFFANNGNADFIGGQGSNFYAASTGETTMSGGVGNVYEFIDNHAGNQNLITNFTPFDALYLAGYGTGATSGILSEIVTDGTLAMTLTDGTRITFQNLDSPTLLDGKIFHI